MELTCPSLVHENNSNDPAEYAFLEELLQPLPHRIPRRPVCTYDVASHVSPGGSWMDAMMSGVQQKGLDSRRYFGVASQKFMDKSTKFLL